MTEEERTIEALNNATSQEEMRGVKVVMGEKITNSMIHSWIKKYRRLGKRG